MARCTYARSAALLACLGAVGAGGAGCSGAVEDDAPGNPGVGAGAMPGTGGAGTPPPGTSGGPPAGSAGSPVMPTGPAMTATGGLPPAPPAATCTTPQAPFVRPRLWLLSSAQYGKSVAAALSGRSSQLNENLNAPSSVPLPFGDVSLAGRFSTFTTAYFMNTARLAEVFKAADAASTLLVAHASVQPCAAGTGPLATCLPTVVKDKGELLFRRPLTAAEVAQYADAALALEATAGRREAVRFAVRALLVAPQFLYRSELGQPSGAHLRLTPFEVASAISYGLTDGPPDVPLWQDATAGTLDAAAIERHVARLTQTLEKRAPVVRFLRELLDYRVTIDMGRANLLPTAEIVADADLTVDNLLKTAGHAGLFAELMTSRSGYARSKTASLYGVMANNPGPITYTGERMGLLGTPAWLSSHAKPDEDYPIGRGLFVQTRLLCGVVPAVDIQNLPPLATGPTLTMRDKLTMHTENPSCRACHGLIDPIGLGLQGFDHFGKARSMEAGRPVDRSGTLAWLDAAGARVEEPFVGLDGLAAKLATSDRALSCFTANTFSFFMGRAPSNGDACTVESAKQRYRAANGDMTAMLQAVFASDTFLNRVK